MKVLLSFLGTGEYKEVPYRLDDQVYTTPYTQEALARHYGDHELLVLLTQLAQAKHGEALRARVPYRAVPIPDGRSTEELWAIFQAVVEAVPEGAELVVDISHGFRSQPVLALAVVHFLEVAKGVKAKRVLYGALREDGEGEFLDLTPFLELLSWTEAVRDLARYGFGRPLAELLKALHRRTWGEKEAGASALAPLGNTLDQLTLSLELLRVEEATQHAQGLLQALERVEKDLARFPASRPLGLLLGTLRTRYAPLAVPDPLSQEGLRAQKCMVDLLLATGSLAQAVALMREMVVTWTCLDKGLDPREEREGAEGLLFAWSRKARQGGEGEKAALGRLWNDLTDLRNDVAHASMRPGPTPARTLEAGMHKVWNQVQEHLGLKDEEGQA
ncbi:TIGR02221 family CRISPR-associated protein [Thermus filiformis]|uniref:TIGR02221 family CRISPR-associated protein n=1 Tax=Thermus filiformis TaxID=276 RepID=UPI00069F8EF7|nr:TIGR02221 family CRISPR-associated protein [Thermus filiformis]